MKKKIGIIFACMLLITYTIPVLGLAEEQNITLIIDQDPNQSWRKNVEHLNDGRLPPDPGEMVEGLVIEAPKNIQIISNPPKRTVSSIHETIIEILGNLDEDLILGYLEDLTDFGPRVTGTTACAQAGDYIYDEFESYGLEARYDDWSYYGYSGNNIEGTLYGTNETSDEIYIICAHYDSVTGSPGADDDGSGTAAVLAAAYLMSQYEFNHTIRFVTFDGEEQGLLGSHEYVEEASGNGDNIVAALNGDMIGYAANPTQASYIKIYENSASEWITDFTEDVSQTYYDYCELTIVPSGYAANSDHASFWGFGYDAIMYHEYQFNPYYHSPQDIIANMDVDYSTRVTRLMVATLGELAAAQIMNTAPNAPTLTGPTTAYEGEEVTFSVTATDPDADDLYYFVDFGNGANSGWIGPFESGETGEISYIYNTEGAYDAKAKAKDIKNGQSDWSYPHYITIVKNIEPEKPDIKGPRVARTGKELEFKFSATDPDGHDVYFYIDWGDGMMEYWLGPYASGEEATFSHTYTEDGTFTIIGKAKDQFNKEGAQTQYKLIILKNRAVTSLPLLRLLEQLMARFPILEQILNLLE